MPPGRQTPAADEQEVVLSLEYRQV